MEPIVVIFLVVSVFFLATADQETLNFLHVVGLSIFVLFGGLHSILSHLPPRVDPYKSYTVKVEFSDINSGKVSRDQVVAIPTGPRGTFAYYRKADH